MNVLITGVSKGIGKELLKLFASSEGINKIFACSSSKKETLFQANKINYLNIDFENSSSIEQIKQTIQEQEIHLMINNAGYLNQGAFHELPVEEARKIFEINYWGPYQLIRAVLPNLEKGKAHVINIGSMGGYQGSAKFPGLSVYSSSKAALSCLTECLAEELKEKKVSFNCLALGAIDTEMLAKAFPGFVAGVSAQEIALYIYDFSTKASHLINGKTLPISMSTP